MTREAQISACPRTTLNASAISDSSAKVQENESVREVPPKPIMTSRSLLVRQIDHLLFGDWIRGTCHVRQDRTQIAQTVSGLAIQGAGSRHRVRRWSRYQGKWSNRPVQGVPSMTTQHPLSIPHQSTSKDNRRRPI